ncbi:MAG: hypothetical protein ACYTDY_04250 [Planctomycetota bacterium]
MLNWDLTLMKGLLVTLVLLSGCAGARASSEPLGEESFPPRPRDHRIVLYDSLSDVVRPFVKIGLIHGRGKGEKIVEAMKEEARKLGGDALVLRDLPGAVSGTSYQGTGVTVTSSRKSAVVLRWTTSR